jgi:hypothetical protein
MGPFPFEKGCFWGQTKGIDKISLFIYFSKHFKKKKSELWVGGGDLPTVFWAV